MLSTPIELATVSYWAYIGTVMLIFMTYTDIKKNRTIDDRKNWVMTGLSISIISYANNPFTYTISVFIILIILRQLFLKFKVIGEGDINALSWIMLGYGLINIFKLFFFALFFALITTIYTGLKYSYIYFLNRTSQTKTTLNVNTPFMPVIFATFVFCNWFFWLY